jgi:DNA processing protein
MLSTNEIYALSLMPNIGPKTLIKIIRANISIELLAQMTDKSSDLIFKGVKSASILSHVKNNIEEFQLKADYNIEQFKAKGVGLISIVDDHYPEQLKLINDPPPLLFYRGNLNLLSNSNAIAVVGTRNCSKFGFNIATQISSYFALKDYVIVSGLALGIDTAAHLGSLKTKDKAIAVVVDVFEISPKENMKLSNLILENGGLLIAENPPHTYISKGAFVDRNRIQTGLSLATFVIESEINGGTMHTAEFAFTQGRLLFCPDYSNLNNQDIGLSTGGIDVLLKTGKALSFNNSNFKSIINTIEAKRKVIEAAKQNLEKPTKAGSSTGTVLKFEF